ncbi:MAG: hypothetical protein ACJAWV_001736 [Flammeovirgaceae bacterium]|jgi:hypothetical protein
MQLITQIPISILQLLFIHVIELFGNETATYKWYKNDEEIEEETDSTYTIGSMKIGDIGVYYCEVLGSSQNISLTITSYYTSVELLCDSESSQSIVSVTNPTICGDEAVIVDLRVANPISTQKYAWFRNGAKVLGAADASFTFNSIGTYKVLTTDTDDCSVFSNEIAVQKSEVTPVFVSIIDDATLQANVPNSSEGFFQWYLNGLELESQKGVTIQVANGGSYTVAKRFPKRSESQQFPIIG